VTIWARATHRNNGHVTAATQNYRRGSLPTFVTAMAGSVGRAGRRWIFSWLGRQVCWAALHCSAWSGWSQITDRSDEGHSRSATRIRAGGATSSAGATTSGVPNSWRQPVRRRVHSPSLLDIGSVHCAAWTIGPPCGRAHNAAHVRPRHSCLRILRCRPDVRGAAADLAHVTCAKAGPPPRDAQSATLRPAATSRRSQSRARASTRLRDRRSSGSAWPDVAPRIAAQPSDRRLGNRPFGVLA